MRKHINNIQYAYAIHIADEVRKRESKEEETEL